MSKVLLDKSQTDTRSCEEIIREFFAKSNTIPVSGKNHETDINGALKNFCMANGYECFLKPDNIHANYFGRALRRALLKSQAINTTFRGAGGTMYRLGLYISPEDYDETWHFEAKLIA